MAILVKPTKRERAAVKAALAQLRAQQKRDDDEPTRVLLDSPPPGHDSLHV